MTKKLLFAFGVLSVALLGGGATYAQKPTANLAPAVPGQDLTKLNIEKVLQQLAPTNVQADGQAVSPLQVVAQFLQLTPQQAAEMAQLVQGRQTTIMPLISEAQTL